MRLIAVALGTLLACSSAWAEGTFNVKPDEYSRLLQLLKAKGVFQTYAHKCEMQEDGTGLRCEDRIDGFYVAYYADDESAAINSITVGSLPKTFDAAAPVAAMAVLSLDPKWLKMPETSDSKKKQMLAMTTKIRSTMEAVFVRAGSDIDLLNGAMLMYFVNKSKEIALVRVVPSRK